MPKRTNLFQQVVALLQSILAEGSRVEESAMLTDLVTGDQREVDVCIFTAHAGHDLLISIECRDHQRRQTVEWVEQEINKHSRLPTNLLVLVSSSGFTKTAMAVAKAANVQLATPNELPPDFLSQIEDLLECLWLKAVGAEPQSLSVVVETGGGPDETSLVALGQDHAIFNADGMQTTDALHLANSLIDNVLKTRLDPLLRDATGEEKFMEVHVDMDPNRAGGPLFLQNIDAHPATLHKIRQMRLIAHVRIDVAPIPMRYAEMRGAQYAYGNAAIPGWEFTLVTTQLDNSTPDWSGRIATRAVPLPEAQA